VTRPPVDTNVLQLQGQISALTEKIQELTIPRPGRPQVWCTIFYREGHLTNECPRMRGMGPPHNPMGPSPRPTGGVAQVLVTPPFHAPVLFHAFPKNQTSQPVEYCEICRTPGHASRKFPIMQKYTTVINTIHFDFFTSTTHATNKCRALDALAKILDRTTFRIKETPQGLGRGQGCGGGGGFIGGINGGGGPGRCYNCNEQGHLFRDYPHPRRTWCSQTPCSPKPDIPLSELLYLLKYPWIEIYISWL
jgi:hypothetical protein